MLSHNMQWAAKEEAILDLIFLTTRRLAPPWSEAPASDGPIFWDSVVTCPTLVATIYGELY